MFFDERLNFIAESSSLIRVSQQGDGATPLVLGNIRAPRNGYAYVYVSNESNEPVFFDDLKVQHRRSALLEETHYYPFGLTMAGISSKKLGSVQEGLLKNEYGYNEKELWDEADLYWYEYGFRNYDAQIGRFVQIDPLADISAGNSGYHYALNDPIANIDYLGLSALDMVRCAWEMSSSLSNLLSVSSVITSIATGAINVAGTIANQQTVIAQGQQGPGLPQAPNKATSENNSQLGKHEPKPAPKGLDAFPEATRIPNKGRATWRDKNGNIYEWDYKKGEVEVYDKTGKEHLGGFDPKTGKQRSPRVPRRRSEYYLRMEGFEGSELGPVLIKVLDRFVSRILGPFLIPESVLQPNPKYTPIMN